MSNIAVRALANVGKALGIKSRYNDLGSRIGVGLNTGVFYPENFVNILGSGDFVFRDDNKSLFTEAYGGNPYVFQVVDRIVARAISAKKRLVDANTGEELPGNAFSDFLQSGMFDGGLNNFLYRLYASFLVGEVFVVMKKSVGFDEPQGLFIPVSWEVTVNEDTNGLAQSYSVKYYNVTRTYELDDVLHIKKPNIAYDSLRGFSGLKGGRKVWQADNEVWNSEAALHKNKGISGVLFSKGKVMTPKEQQEMQHQYDMQSTGQQFGKVRVSSIEVGYQSMGMNMADLKSIEARLDHLRATCGLFNVDPKLFGDSAGSTYNNMPDAKRGLITDAVIPLVDYVNSELISWIAPKLGIDDDFMWKINEDLVPELMRPNIELSQKVIAEVQAGILTPEQASEILYPGMDFQGDNNETIEDEN